MADIKQVTVDTFDELLNEDIPVVVDFWAPWCGPCRSLAPTVEEVANEMAGSVVFAKCNVDDNQDVAMRYGVMSIPTLVVIKHGQESGRIVGALPKAQLMAELKQYL